jgi:hypothetical protein
MSAELERRIAQLSALIEERSLLLNILLESPEKGCTPEAVWINDGGFNAA